MNSVEGKVRSLKNYTASVTTVEVKLRSSTQELTRFGLAGMLIPRHLVVPYTSHVWASCLKPRSSSKAPASGYIPIPST